MAAFFAITLIEEVGKVAILANERTGGKFNDKAFYDHEKKYAYAVAYNLIMNSRVTRLYGNLEERFAKWFKKGELFSIRNDALYLDKTDSGTRVPTQAIWQEDACLLVCIAGEIYAEIQGGMTGTGAREWQRILGEVDIFREKNLSKFQKV